MSHLYLHIPFCKQKCSYCNFHFSVSMQLKKPMLQAMVQEIQNRKHEIDNQLKTIYLGGGTPSVLNEKDLGILFKAIEKNFEINPKVEITLEANPDDLDNAKLKEIRQFPINRLSIGVQSFFDEDLVFMNRAHNAQQAENSIKRSQDIGLENITIDLIYGSPTTSNEFWSENLNKALALDVPHISSYALTVEPQTALDFQIKKKLVPPVDDEKQQIQFEMLVKQLTENGFDHYEISNFGKPGFYSQHNTSYWLGENYLGIGPSAHSFNGIHRSWNIANNPQYISKIQQNLPAHETEILSEKDRINELTMIGLRTIYGIDLNKIESGFSEEIKTEWKQILNKMLEENKVKISEQKVLLNPDFQFFADGIASDWFIV